jgi:hypothetical protein
LVGGGGNGDVKVGLARTGRLPDCSPVAINVIFTSGEAFGISTVPKMMLASSSARFWMICAASLTSLSVRSGPPVMLIRIPFAPSIENRGAGC